MIGQNSWCNRCHCIYWHETKAHRVVARVRLQLSWHVVGTGKTEGQARDIG